LGLGIVPIITGSQLNQAVQNANEAYQLREQTQYYADNKIPPYDIDKRVGVLPRAVKHLEPASFGQLIPKFFRWGYTGVNAKYGKYHNLMAKKERFRTGMFKKGLILESIASMTLLVIKGIPYKIGYLLGRVDKALGINRYK